MKEVSNIADMFHKAEAVDQDLSAWNSTSKVTFKYIFFIFAGSGLSKENFANGWPRASLGYGRKLGKFAGESCPELGLSPRLMAS